MPSDAQIITFYSYKGGSGRTLLLANVAWILASAGNRVLAIDWDLEAPGLHRYFRPFLVDKNCETSPGIIDLVMDYAVAATTPGNPVDPDWSKPFANILRNAVSLDWDFQAPGTLDFVPAGRLDDGYARRVNGFDWQKFYERLGGGTFLESVKQKLRQEYDYVLIDSRTGITDTAGITTQQMPDSVVACFTYSRQSVDGIAAVLAVLTDQRSFRRASPPRLFPIPMRVESAELARLERIRAFARETIRPFVRMDSHLFDEYWHDVETPYVPIYAYSEMLAPFVEDSTDRLSLLASAIRVTKYLTDGQVTGMRLVEPWQKEAVRAKADW